jgi:hypothetical protein
VPQPVPEEQTNKPTDKKLEQIMVTNHGVNSKRWTSLRGQIKRSFSQLSDGTLEHINEDLETLSESLQNAYGLAKDVADREVERFKMGFGEAGSAEKLTNGGKRSKKEKRKSAPRKVNKTNTINTALYGIH